ncbi:MAG TPA: hypothetical protein VMU05_06410 [Dongiaceae bacterium]|nr:hypothetical protein [Dongiaceae bacterium]
MSLRKFFMCGFVGAFGVAAILASGVLLFGKWGEEETKILLTAVSIGVYSLIALCCATVYEGERWKLLATAGITMCGIGLAFALLTNWQIVEPGFKVLLKGRIAFLSISIAFGATALMLKQTSDESIVELSRALTIVLIWVTTCLFNFILLLLADAPGSKEGVVRLTGALSILALLGVVATPILRRIYK